MLSFESVSLSCADAAKEIDATVTKSDLAKNDAGWVIFIDSAQLQGPSLAYFSAILALVALWGPILQRQVREMIIIVVPH